MFLSAVDPALLIYQLEHWQSRQSHFFIRIKALALHHRFTRQYSQQIAISNQMASIVQESFPWDESFRTIPELRDVRRFILDEFARAYFISSSRGANEITVRSSGATSEYVDNDLVRDAWKELLFACSEEEKRSALDAQVATWEISESQAIVITVGEGSKSEEHRLPLVRNERDWVSRLNAQDHWPELQRCVDLYFGANLAMQHYLNVREQPIAFECTDQFWRSIGGRCEVRMRHPLIKAIAKKVYGILDAKLGDESFGHIRRFRVNDFWRVHYRDTGDGIVLEEFGRHDMGF